MAWRTRSIEAFGAVEAAASEAELFGVLVAYAGDLGASLVSYHHIAPNVAGGSPVGNGSFAKATPKAVTEESGAVAPPVRHRNLFAHGFPETWVKAYRDLGYYKVDPITAYAAYQTRPVLWSQVDSRIVVTPEQQDYLDVLWAWLAPGDGMAVPCFGPSGRHGYVGIGSRAPLSDWSPEQVRLVQSVAESFHLRFCELRLAGLPKDFTLSEREGEVLTLMSRGHADWLISAVTGTTPERVAAVVDSLLSKMGVTDRPSALIRARGLGLIG